MGRLIDWLITTSQHRRVAVLAATAALVIAGGWAFATLNTDAFPDLTPLPPIPKRGLLHP